MHTRTWQPGDPEPDDHPDVIDTAGDTWSFEYYSAEVLEIDPLQPGESPGGWWLKGCHVYDSGDLWPWSEVTSRGPVHEAG